MAFMALTAAGELFIHGARYDVNKRFKEDIRVASKDSTKASPTVISDRVVFARTVGR